jgi:hypothetical protein
MEPDRILDELSRESLLPATALRAATENRATMAPIFVDKIERYLAGEPCAPNLIFFAFHLLGEWRETAGYRSMAKLLRRPSEELDKILDDAVTETIHRVMAAVFDGDPQPLYDVILDPSADQHIRSAMLDALGMVTREGLLPREEAKRFLIACYDELQPRDDCYVWNGWQSAIAMLGLAELKPLVWTAFEKEYIERWWLGFADFEKDLRQVIEDPSKGRFAASGDYDLFGDTVETFSDWYGFSAKALRDRRKPAPAATEGRDWRDFVAPQKPAFNPLKGIGRNDPCPCGSGKKYKKCCLNARPEGEAIYNEP